jgi:hypothetical protein
VRRHLHAALQVAGIAPVQSSSDVQHAASRALKESWSVPVSHAGAGAGAFGSGAWNCVCGGGGEECRHSVISSAAVRLAATASAGGGGGEALTQSPTMAVYAWVCPGV